MKWCEMMLFLSHTKALGWGGGKKSTPERCEDDSRPSWNLRSLSRATAVNQPKALCTHLILHICNVREQKESTITNYLQKPNSYATSPRTCGWSSKERERLIQTNTSRAADGRTVPHTPPESLPPPLLRLCLFPSACINSSTHTLVRTKPSMKSFKAIQTSELLLTLYISLW